MVHSDLSVGKDEPDTLKRKPPALEVQGIRNHPSRLRWSEKGAVCALVTVRRGKRAIMPISERYTWPRLLYP